MFQTLIGTVKRPEGVVSTPARGSKFQTLIGTVKRLRDAIRLAAMHG